MACEGRSTWGAAFAAAVLALAALPSSAALVGDFTPLPVPEGGLVNKCIATSDTAIWGCGTSGSTSRATVFRIDIQSGAAEPFPLGAEFGDDPIVLAITAGAGGSAWFIGAELGPGPLPVPSGGAFLGEIGADGSVSTTPLLPTAFDNNLYPSIAYDPASDTVAWTQAHGVAPSIGILETQGSLANVDFGAPGFPTSIAFGADGDLYFTDTFLTGIRIGRIAPNGVSTFPGEVDFAEPTGPGGGEPPLIVSGADGNLYFTVPALGQICRLTPTGTITHFTVQSGAGEIPSLAVGQDGRLYFGEPSSGSVRRLDPSTAETEDFTLPSNFATFVYNLLAPSPVMLSGDDAVLAAGFAGPGLLRLREAGSACPQVWQRNLAPIVIETRRSFFRELGIPPDKPIHVAGNPFGIVVSNHPQFFGIGGATANPGQYTISVTTADPASCPVDLFTIPVDVSAPPVRRVIPVTEPVPVAVDPRH